MKHGLVLTPPDPVTLGKWSNLAEETGFDAIWVTDSQSLYREVFASVGVCLSSTRRISCGPCVINPITRHPAVAASAIATLSEMHGERAILGLGSGDSAVLNLGMKPARVEQVRSYLIALRSLLEEGHAEYEGRTCILNWFKRCVPLYLAAEGPRMLRLAGKLADGVIIGSGLIPEIVHDSRALIEEGARTAGRRIEDIDLWWMAKVSVHQEGERARREIRAGIAGSAHHVFNFTLEGKHVPPRIARPIQELRRRYVFNEHAMAEKETNAALVDELGLRDFLLDRFAIAGTPEECRARLNALEEMGIEKIRLTAHVPDRPAFMRLWSEEVMDS
jgi:5,10-methylenetetrahydromethanopterin reductase